MTKFIFLAVLFILLGCQNGSRPSESQNSVQLITSTGAVIPTRLAVTMKEQEQGLSGVKSEDFEENEGMIFFYLAEDERHFWMPDTYFDLDLFFLDKDLVIRDIIRKLPHYIGRANPDYIPRARGVWSRHVLEMKSTSPIAASLAVGQQLQWKSKLSLQEFEKKVSEDLKKQ